MSVDREFIDAIRDIPVEVLTDELGIMRGTAQRWKDGTSRPIDYVRNKAIRFAEDWRAKHGTV